MGRPSSNPHFGQEHPRAPPEFPEGDPAIHQEAGPGSQATPQRAKQEATSSVLTEVGTWGATRSGAGPGVRWRAGGRDACWVRASGDRCVPLRTLLQQLQKLQTLVTNKISRPYKMAATQTGTCLMVGLLPPSSGLRRASSPGGFLGGVGRPWKDWQYDGQHHQGTPSQCPVASFTKSSEPSRAWPSLTSSNSVAVQ